MLIGPRVGPNRPMAKKEPELNIPCPRCGKSTKMTVDLDLKAASNVSVMECPEDGCDHRFAKDQSVKLSGTLVLEAAECMESIGGYTSLGEFVRETIRGRTANVRREDNTVGFGMFMKAIAEDPETWLPLLEDDYEEEDG